MSVTNKLKSSGYWQSIEVVTLFIVQFSYFAIMARLLNKTDFGIMAIANSIIAFGSIFAENGMGAAIIQKKEITCKHINAALQGSIVTGGLLFILTLFLAPLVAELFNQPDLEPIIQVISVNFILLTLGSVSLGLLHKKFLFKRSSIITVVSITLAYSIGVIFGVFGFGVWSLVVSALLYSFFKLIGYLYSTPIKLHFKIYFKEWKELFSFGFGMILLKVNNYMGSSGLNLFLGKALSIDLLGVFERTYQLKTMPSSYLGNILDKIMFPVMSEIQDEEERLFKVYQHSLGLVNSILMPLAAFLVIFSEEIVIIMLGENWMEAVVPLMLMFVVLPFSSSGRMADSVLRAKGLIYRNASRKFVYVIVLLSTTIAGAYYYGIIGAAVGVTFSYLFNYVFMLFLVKRVFNKTVNEIFIPPIIQGVKLTAVIIILSYIFLWSLSFLIQNGIALFLIVALLIGGIAVYISMYKPSLLGHYLDVTIEKILDKKTS